MHLSVKGTHARVDELGLVFSRYESRERSLAARSADHVNLTFIRLSPTGAMIRRLGCMEQSFLKMIE